MGISKTSNSDNELTNAFDSLDFHFFGKAEAALTDEQN